MRRPVAPAVSAPPGSRPAPRRAWYKACVALKNRCQACDFVIEAADAQRGQEVLCPKCGAPNVLRTPEEAKLAAAEAHLARTRERQRFLEGLSRAGPRRDADPGWSAPVERGLEAAPLGDAGVLAALAGQRLKDVSTWLAGLGYLILGLFVVLGGVFAAGSTLDTAWKLFGLLGLTLVGVVLFVFLKFLADTTRALADLADLGRSLEARLGALGDAVAALRPPAAEEPAPEAAEADRPADRAVTGAGR